MADRPTPEEIAYTVVAELSELPTSPLALQLDWEDECRIVERFIRAERAEADRRVAEERARGDALERERDQLRKHYDAAGGEHNLLALLDLYHQRALDAERERDQLRARVAVGRRAWAAVHEALGIRPDGLAGILGTIEDLKEERVAVVRWLETDEMNWRGNEPVLEQPQALAERIERGEHRQDTPAREVDVPGCTCGPCPACVRHFDLEHVEGNDEKRG